MSEVVMSATIHWPFVMTTRRHPRRRAHLVVDAYTAWFRGRPERLMARAACGSELLAVQAVMEVPDDSALCDACALADYIRPCVYRFFDAAGHVLYIGCTKGLIGRLQGHASSPASREMWRQVYRFEYRAFGGHAEALAVEAAEIAMHRPPYNKDVSGRAPKPPFFTPRRSPRLPVPVTQFLPTEVRTA